jgi:hypothetical protein
MDHGIEAAIHGGCFGPTHHRRTLVIHGGYFRPTYQNT